MSDERNVPPDVPPDVLDAETVLRRADGLSVRLRASGSVVVQIGETVDAGQRGLALLDAFARPRTIAAALEQAAPAGREDFLDTMSAVLRLQRAGVLVGPGAAGPRRGGGGFGSAALHVSMLDDRQRTRAFLDAIAAVVRPGDTVVEIGTGTGILSVAAARAGARKVYAIEVNARIARVAQAVFERNGVADRVQLIEGISTAVALPERADVLVSETLGSAVMNEGFLGTIADARARLLKDDARLIPAEIELLGIATEVPEALVRRSVSTDTAQADWRAWYDVDLAPLADLPPDPRRPFVSDEPTVVAAWPRLAEPVSLARIETARVESDFRESRTDFRIERPGLLSGITLAFEARLVGDLVVGNVPGRADSACNWYAPTWPVHPPRSVAAGEALTLRLRAGNDGLYPQLVQPE